MQIYFVWGSWGGGWMNGSVATQRVARETRKLAPMSPVRATDSALLVQVQAALVLVLVLLRYVLRA